MKITKFLLASLIAGCFAFTACSDDDDNDIVGGDLSGTPGVVNPAQVFTDGLPTQVGDWTITKGANGRVTKIVEDGGSDWEYTYSFNYTGSRADVSANVPAHDVFVRVTRKDGSTVWIFYVLLNESGFAKYALQDYGDGDTDEWWFGYNSNGQLNYLKRSEGDNEVTSITYDANGDIVKVEETDDEGDIDTDIIKYTNSTVSTAIANKGAIMQFDDLFSIDMDEFGPVYYAGMLGKATTHLPVEKVNSWIDEGVTKTETTTFKWTLNNNGFPASLVENYDGYDSTPVFFNWN